MNKNAYFDMLKYWVIKAGLANDDTEDHVIFTILRDQLWKSVYSTDQEEYEAGNPGL